MISYDTRYIANLDSRFRAEDLVDHSSQLLKGVLDMCLLSLIAEEPSYGYEMAAKLEDRGLRLVSEGSIYPALSRLQKTGLVEGYFVEVDGSGPPRKYYRLATEGRAHLTRWTDEWEALSTGVSSVLNGGIGDV
jgi:PadR family transcriptional regulator